MAETIRLAVSDVPVGTYFTATIADRAELCLKLVGGEVLVVSDEPPHLLATTSGDILVTTIAAPSFRPQPDGIADRRRKPQFGDIILWSRNKSHQGRALCAKRDDTSAAFFVDLASGESLALPAAEGAISSLWSKWEALDRQRSIVCRFPPRRWTP